ncbi:MAG TPA: bifunctional diaminohydroxyphosphoribosylaminopyrimidine deaminase/5-amino-6-(5-phosphoribosylamino)uracil reductase RibD, partial [Chitinophagaceae bacterium]|nr:bifunctional diaminohydroxyphosphoribosylaminopyrimidine deaminase/5-amino-6-(5-phosphoribosylamino)uracil reductase RibD [Chitinophagaceae bacterium]
EAHAEVNCINAVNPDDFGLIHESTLYVSLEPCSHHGKTPPCVDLIISKKIPEVVIGCRDPFKEVSGRGIAKLKAADINVIENILENECRELNKRFITFQEKHRPYIILKWAQTADKKIAPANRSQLSISNEASRKIVHKWRSEEASILVGTNTAESDDPELSNRHWQGTNPLRLVVDMDLSLPSSLKIFDQKIPTIVFNTKQHTFEKSEFKGVNYYQVTNDVSLPVQIANALYQLNIQSVLVEGGARLLQSFIDEGEWDEVRTITNPSMNLPDGIAVPKFEGVKVCETDISGNLIEIYKPMNKA